jgi:hypothetical protein
MDYTNIVLTIYKKDNQWTVAESKQGMENVELGSGRSLAQLLYKIGKKLTNEKTESTEEVIATSEQA